MESYKPGFLEFIKFRMMFKKNQYIEYNNKKFVESKASFTLSFFSNLIIILTVVILSNYDFFSRLKVFFQVMVIFLVVMFLLFVLETIHWLYAKFELIEEKNNKVDTKE